jgi:hypothetical protein
MKPGRRAVGVVYPAVFGALALVFLYAGAVSPTGNWGLAAAAGLMPAAVIISAGLAAGVLCWAGVSILAFLLLPDKFMALLFGLLFGLYAIVKNLAERLRRLPLEYILKLLFFNVSFTVIYVVMRSAVLSSLPEQLSAVWALYLAGNVVFLAYDYGFGKLIGFYMARVYKPSR